jgi:hypothetical protein
MPLSHATRDTTGRTGGRLPPLPWQRQARQRPGLLAWMCRERASLRDEKEHGGRGLSPFAWTAHGRVPGISKPMKSHK